MVWGLGFRVLVLSASRFWGLGFPVGLIWNPSRQSQGMKSSWHMQRPTLTQSFLLRVIHAGETLRTPDPCMIMCRGRQGGCCCLDLSH